MASIPRRHTHRKRNSALKLSSDTTSTLPEYLPPSGWQNQHNPQQIQENEEDLPLDKPPDYPDSAEEADEDTDTDSNVVYVPQFPPAATLTPRPHTSSPRRGKRFLPAHKRRFSSQLSQPQSEPSSDPFLDSLLERSVHALEMSNTLLQSSISTQTSLSAILASDSHADSTLEARAINLSSRIRDTWDVRAGWADDLEEITRNVEGLFGRVDDGISDSALGLISSPRSSLLLEGSGGISCSLPSSSSLSNSIRRNRRRPSLDLRQASDPAAPRLHLSQQSRANLVSPPPRALTQYVASTQDTESLVLPSTIGLRALPSTHHTPDWKPLSDFASSSTTSLLSTPSLSTPSLPPKLTDKSLDPSTPAYHMLSSFVYRQPSSGSGTPSTSFTTSFMASIRRDTRNSNTSTERSNSANCSTRGRSSSSPRKSPDVRQERTTRSSRSSVSSSSRTPKRGVSPLSITVHRPMTPPAEESSSSSDGCVAKLTVQSLRKILDDQPELSSKASSTSGHLRPPQFMPRTPAPVAESGTSTATASISRLFTKGTHSSSTRAPSPPRRGAMKHSRDNSVNGSLGGSAPPTPTTTSPPQHVASSSSLSALGSISTPYPSPTTLTIPDMVSKVLGGRLSAVSSAASTSSSGMSTPNKRISFAELPESYASTRPGGAGSGRFRDKQSSRRKRKANGKARDADGPENSTLTNPEGAAGLGGWWNGWLGAGAGASSSSGPGGLSLSLARQEERMEDRMTRSWGGRMGAGFGSGVDDWAV